MDVLETKGVFPETKDVLFLFLLLFLLFLKVLETRLELVLLSDQLFSGVHESCDV